MRKVKWLAVCLALVLLTAVFGGITVSADLTGASFTMENVYASLSPLSQLPSTFEATVRFDASTDGSKPGGVILGNFYDANTACVSFEIYYNGNPRLYIIDNEATVYDFVFDEISVYTGEWTHVAIVKESVSGTLSCYINGEWQQTLELPSPEQVTISHSMCIGGDFRDGNSHYFKGELSSVAFYSDVRTAREIRKDSFAVKPDMHELMGYYDLIGAPDTLQDVYGEGIEFGLISRSSWVDGYQPVTDYDYAFAVMGDTQTLTCYYPEKLPVLYDWIVDNAEQQKLKFVFGLGDITEQDTQTEWTLAKSQIQKLKDVVPYSVIRGNHDSTDNFDSFFAFEEYKDAIAGSYNDTMMYTYQKLEVGGLKYLIVNMDINASDKALEWANNVIAEHSDYNVIITTHMYLATDGEPIEDGKGTTMYGGVNDCNQWWEKMIKKHPNVVLVLSGHVPTDRIITSQRAGENGNIVTQMLVDPQTTDVTYEGAGLIALLKFSDGGKRVNVEYYSPIHNQYFLAENQFEVELNVIQPQSDAPWYETISPWWLLVLISIAVIVIIIVAVSKKKKNRVVMTVEELPNEE